MVRNIIQARNGSDELTTLAQKIGTLTQQLTTEISEIS